MNTQTDLSFEPAGVLNADAANIQALLAQVNLLMGAGTKASGATIIQYAEGAVEDFNNGLSDLNSDLQAAYARIEAELDRRDAKLEREHVRIESGKLINAVAAE